jgi:glycyl-tRNA synthetase beta chain
MRDLLFEIGTEELPAGFLAPALSQLEELFRRKAAALRLGHGRLQSLGTPRRLALQVFDLAERQEEGREELLGPSRQAGIDSAGAYTRAAEGFARSKGATVDQLQVVATAKGEYLMLIREVAGQPTSELLGELLHSVLVELTFAKSMRWGSNLHPFGRPIQWLVALFGNQVIPFNHEGVVSGNVSRGHRFLAPEPFPVDSPAEYPDQLAQRFVLADPLARRAQVVQEITAAAAQAGNWPDARVAVDEALVDTVTNLVEYPFAICGLFDEKFLQLPAAVLITSMREHQKYFPVVDGENRLLAGFVAVNNTRVLDPATTRKGHQRVLRARLEDALFFFNSDRQTRLEARIPQLQGIIFQAGLGTMLEKNDRLVKLVRILADQLAPELAEECCRAALLCKTDLLSAMVGEFPTLQGTMGAAYARFDGESEAVALAIEEHYLPKRAGVEIAGGETGALLGLADRIDTLAGFFGIGKVPSGTADPFGLRRISLATLAIIAGKGYRLSLHEIIHKALALYGNKVDGSGATVEAVLNFLQGRFVNDLISRGWAAELVEAATSVAFDDLNDCLLRIEALAEIQRDPAFVVLAGSYKRVRNIVKDNHDTVVDPGLFAEEAERRLYQLYLSVAEEMHGLIAEDRYAAALTAMLRLTEPVDSFFDTVMVMAEEPQIRQNRLNLLTGLGELILQIGDISKMG